MGLDDFLTDGAAFAERERADEGTTAGATEGASNSLLVNTDDL